MFSMGSKSKSSEAINETESPIPTAAPTASSSSAAPPLPPPWIELPGDVTANILRRLGAERILTSAQQVCTTWWKVCKDPSMWRVIDFCNPEQINLNEKYTVMCRRAVDRSQGQLVDLTIDYFGDDELMAYIADRSQNLKRLKLRSCNQMRGYSVAIAKLLQLEELHLTMMPCIVAADVEAIGNSCPKLKSFSYNKLGLKHRLALELEDDDINEGFRGYDYALAIGKSMTNLRHLQLIAHLMRNEGLEAILNGCTRLESLDIRECFDLDLDLGLGRRCRQQIKDIRFPTDPVSDVPWLKWDGSNSYFRDYDSDYSDSDYSDYDYSDYECYDDYSSPLGYGFFNDDGPGLFYDDYF